MADLTKKEREIVSQIRHKGFAVVIFTEEELNGASHKHVEDRLIELGWEVIECLKD